MCQHVNGDLYLGDRFDRKYSVPNECPPWKEGRVRRESQADVAQVVEQLIRNQ